MRPLLGKQGQYLIYSIKIRVFDLCILLNDQPITILSFCLGWNGSSSYTFESFSLFLLQVILLHQMLCQFFFKIAFHYQMFSHIFAKYFCHWHISHMNEYSFQLRNTRQRKTLGLVVFNPELRAYRCFFCFCKIRRSS